MSAQPGEWQPGDPLTPDNGCGTIPTISMTNDERADVIAEGGTPPPWTRPPAEGHGYSPTRYCYPCGVRWAGGEPCWMCGEGAA